MDASQFADFLKVISAAISSVTVSGVLLAALIYQTKKLDALQALLITELQNRAAAAEAKAEGKPVPPLMRALSGNEPTAPG